MRINFECKLLQLVQREHCKLSSQVKHHSKRSKYSHYSFISFKNDFTIPHRDMTYAFSSLIFTSPATFSQTNDNPPAPTRVSLFAPCLPRSRFHSHPPSPSTIFIPSSDSYCNPKLRSTSRPDHSQLFATFQPRCFHPRFSITRLTIYNHNTAYHLHN